MSLLKKTFFIITIIIVVLIASLYIISEIFFLSSFEKIEKLFVKKDVESVLNILFNDLRELNSAVGDWAAWDETYSFIQNGNPNYVKKNLPDETYAELRLNLVLFVNSAGEIIFGRAFDLQKKEGIPLPREIKKYIYPDSPLLKHPGPESSIYGLVNLSEGIMMVASRPILKSNREGPVRGSVIFGRFLNEIEIGRWSEIARMPIYIQEVKEQMPKDFLEAISSLKNNEIFIKAEDSKVISGYAKVNNIYDKPAFLLKINQTRDIYNQGRVTLNYFILFIALSSFLFIGVIIIILKKSVLLRLSNLRKSIKNLDFSTNIAFPIDLKTKDELSEFSIDLLESIAYSRLLFSNILENLPEGILLLNSDNRVVFANKIGLDYLNILSNAKIGDLLSQLGNFSINDLIFSSNSIWHNIEKDGRIFEIAVRMIGNDKKGSTVFVVRDVTQERKMLEQLHAQERLATVGQLAAGIAHDFNNILTGIIGYAEMYQSDENLSPNVRHALKVIRKNGDRAAALIRQILDFSRKSLIDFKIIDIVAFLRESIAFIKRTIPENIEIIFETDNDKYLVLADKNKLQQAIMNLVVNSKDAMPKGGKLTLKINKIFIKKQQDSPLKIMPPGEWICISISDTGIGIPQHILPHIFEPFYTTKEVGKGTGLGLSQVYGIIKQHNGYIDVKSEQGVGTTFFIYLTPVDSGREPSIQEEEKIVLPKGEGESILIVEDDSSVSEFLEAALNSCGYKVFIANNGHEALKIFNENKDNINLIITDLVMPGIDGIKLSSMLREINESVKIIAITGYPMKLDRDMLHAGIIHWVEKPIHLVTFLQTVKKALEKNNL